MSGTAPTQRYIPSLRVWLSLTSLLLILALGASLSISLQHFAGAALEREVGERLQAKARSLAGRLQSGLAERLSDARMLAATVEVRERRPQQARALFDRLRQGAPELAWIGLADRSGRVIAASAGMLEGADVSARPWFQRGLNGEHFGDVHEALLLARLLPRQSNQPLRLVDIALPLRADDGSVNGVLGMHLSWDWAYALGTALSAEAGGQTTVRVRAESGELLLELPAPAEPNNRGTIAPAASADQIEGWQYDTQAALLSGWAEADSRAPQGSLRWQVEVEQPASSALAGLDHLHRQVLAVTAGVMLLAAFAAAVLARVIGLPLRHLARAASEHRRGEGQVRIPSLSGYREVQQLSHALQGLVQDLSTLAQELEQRVNQRTDELAQANIRLQLLAATDPLTGIANRRQFVSQLSTSLQANIAAAEGLALMLIDIDHFKSINDRHGHPGGDFVLRELAQYLREYVEPGDLAARIGGEEFALLLHGADADAALDAAASLRAGFSARLPILYEDEQIHLSLSVGLAVQAAGIIADVHSQAEQLYARADAALYRAKREGRDRAILG
jgi:diguanylate cyclase (GGDEF)-like protein